MIYISDEISHHGVKGMKWGVRKNTRNRISTAYNKKYYTPTNEKDAHLYALKSAIITGLSQGAVGLGLNYVLNKKGLGAILPSNKTYLITSGMTVVATLLNNEKTYIRTGKIKKI